MAAGFIQWKNGVAPKPPYYASIFNYTLGNDLAGYEEMDEETLKLAQATPGYLGFESHKSGKRGSFISYWKDLEAIATWRKNTVHQAAKRSGQQQWYSYYSSMIAKVESASFHSIGN
jgi:heme-degrading monooxygenase HmoA